ncbi:MAG: hypothetical protein ACRDDY_02660 [Clostridium sp.]|uniref:hypothetical protein n=1 Tax=Clostridium sp. TaxID=1506 RepID=UPI003EE4A088
MKNLTSYLKVNNIAFGVFDTKKEEVKRICVRVEELNKYPKIVKFIKDNYFWEMKKEVVEILALKEE